MLFKRTEENAVIIFGLCALVAVVGIMTVYDTPKVTDIVQSIDASTSVSYEMFQADLIELDTNTIIVRNSTGE